MRRISALLLLLALASARAQAEETIPADAGATGFHLEGKPQIDDIFGDAADYRRAIDRFLELTTQMQAMRDGFARAVQAALAELNHKGERGRGCPEGVVAPYAKARRLGGEYLRVGRELTRHYEEVKELDRLGETVGLTPDYRWKVKRVLQKYQALLTDYREMKVALHDALDDELKYAGCDLAKLIQHAEGKEPLPGEETWPAPGQPGAPGVVIAKTEPPHETIPPSLPPEKVPPREPIALPRRSQPGEAERTRSGVLFYVDNTRCQRGTQVFLDGKRLGEVPAATRVGFQTAAGPHDLCLFANARPGAPEKQCGQPGTVRRSYLHEGWTISLRCE